MVLVTVQNKKVFDTLAHNAYYAPAVKSDNLKSPYQMMCKHYKWDITAPVFACVKGKYCNFFGCNTENAYILTLNVPDNIVKLQDYYNWVDIIYFTEFPNEWESSMSFTEFTAKTLDGLGTDDPRSTIQATIPYIRPEWLTSYKPFTENFNKYIGSGGNTKLEDI